MSWTRLSDFTFIQWRRKWQPTPVFLPGDSQGWGAWWVAIYGVTQNWTWLKRLSSSSRVPIKSEYCLESIFIHLILLCPWRGFSGWNIMMSLLLYAWGHSKIVELAQGHPVTDLVSSWIQSFVSECLLILLDHNYFWTWGPEFHQ